MSAKAKAKGPRATTPEPLLVADEVSKSVHDIPLLAPVSVGVAAGRCLVLRGENGSGKTTLMRLLSGTTEPTTGRVTLDGRTVDERDPTCRRAVAALVGAPTAYRDLTLVDHLVLVDATWGRGAGADDRAMELLASLEIDHLDDRFPHELSSGQQQLFHLALALGRPSRVLLLDEPEQRLDTHKRSLLGDLLVARKQDGTSLVVACHDPLLTEAIADQVIDIEPA